MSPPHAVLPAAQDLSNSALGGPIHIRPGGDHYFTDPHNRTLHLRGLNVSGASKLPTEPNGLSHLTEGFYETYGRVVTFVGRPFPLAEAPLHFRRLREWGLPLIRLLVTWEALAHSGPDIRVEDGSTVLVSNGDQDDQGVGLDWEYIAYLRELIAMMSEYGIKCFVCAHQDVWSRFSGGSGAPGWTFEIAGLDIKAFYETGAAYVHGIDEQRKRERNVDPKEIGGPFLWPSGYQKLAASTMATIFWAGEALAPGLTLKQRRLMDDHVDEKVLSAQEVLQSFFIEAYGALADALEGMEAVLGFEPMNEPHRGLINLHNFHEWNYNTDLHIGHNPSLAQALALGSGYAQTVKYYVKSWPHPTGLSHKSVIDPKGRSAWLPRTSGDDSGKCLWHAHGVWEWDETKKVAKILLEDYFDIDHRPGHEGRRIEWYRDCYAPFVRRFSERVARKSPQYMAFVEPLPNEFLPPWPSSADDADVGDGIKSASKRPSAKQLFAEQTVLPPEDRPSNFVYAPHFYDLNVLFMKHHGIMSVNVQGLSRGMFVLNALYFGAEALKENYRKQIGNILKFGQIALGNNSSKTHREKPKATPIVIGEIGIPFDINGRAALSTGNYDKQRELMHALITAMEDVKVDGFTLWNYNPDNRAAWGDGWNEEDFSIVNGDGDAEAETEGLKRQGQVVLVKPDYRNAEHEQDELYRGARVIDVVVRPYAVKVAGVPERSDWNPHTLKYVFEWSGNLGLDEDQSEVQSDLGGDATSDPNIRRRSDIYIPSYHYGKHELRVRVSDGCTWRYDKAGQSLYVWHNAAPETSRQVANFQLELEIDSVWEHLIDRARQRRRAFPQGRLGTVVSIELETWWESVDMRSYGVAWMSAGAVFAGLAAWGLGSALKIW